MDKRVHAAVDQYLKRHRVKIVDPAGKYYKNYCGVYFEDPDGMELEGMWYDDKGEASV